MRRLYEDHSGLRGHAAQCHGHGLQSARVITPVVSQSAQREVASPVTDKTPHPSQLLPRPKGCGRRCCAHRLEPLQPRRLLCPPQPQPPSTTAPGTGTRAQFAGSTQCEVRLRGAHSMCTRRKMTSKSNVLLQNGSHMSELVNNGCSAPFSSPLQDGARAVGHCRPRY